MDKVRVIEKFVDKHCVSTTRIIRLDCADENGETPDDKTNELYKNYMLSEDYEITMFPTVILEAKLPDGSGLELSRTEGGVSFKAFETTFTQAMEAFGKQVEADEGRSQNEASKDLPWA